MDPIVKGLYKAAARPANARDSKGKPGYEKRRDGSDVQISHQSMQAQKDRRDLTRDEQEAIAENEANWWPKIFPSLSDSPAVGIANPVKVGILKAILPALIGGVGGSMVGAGFSGTPAGANTGALLGALALGGGAGLWTGLRQNQKNADIVEMIRRLPMNATRRDMVADPYYIEQKRQSADNLRTGMLASALLAT